MFDPARDSLIFEGAWDAFACAALLKAHRRTLPDPQPFRNTSASAGLWFGRGWTDALRRFRATAANAAPGSRVAVVIDNDPPSPPQPSPDLELTSSFAAIGVQRSSLVFRTGVGPLSTPRGIAVGAWLMPDDLVTGSLDDFLIALLRPADGVAEWARHAVQIARIRGGGVKPSQDAKAQLRVFLAFHDPPDANYGQAINALHFDTNATAAIDFVAWFDRVFP